MTSYLIGGGGDGGTGFISVPISVDWFDQGDFGSVAPFNPKIGVPIKLFGTLKVLRHGPEHNPIPMTVTLTAGNTGNTGFRVQAKIVNNVISTPVFLVGKTALSIFLTGPIAFAVFMGGDLPVSTYGQLTREYFNDLTGIRQSFPWLIYQPNITHYSQIVINGTYQQPINQPFLISAAFDPARDPFMTSLGGQANWIGMVLQQTVSGNPVTVVRFRAPELNEIVIVRGDPNSATDSSVVMRWNGSAWVGYETMPERAVSGELAFQILDPQGIYDYYAKLLGMVLAQWQYDTAHLITFIDTLTCPEDLVSLLADNFGLDILNETPTERKREFIRQFITLEKEKGVDQSVRDALRVLGYTGYAMNVWVIPGGDQFAYIEKPIGYDTDPPSTYFPASQVGIHMNDLQGNPLSVIDDGLRADTADFLKRYILPAHVQIRFFATDFPVSATTGDVTTLSDTITFADI